MSPKRPKSQPRRRPLFRIEAECLEGRQLLTGGAGNTIALTTGNVADAGGASTTKFVVESRHFTVPKGHLTLGVDVVAANGSKLTPQIASVTPEGTAHSRSILTKSGMAMAKASASGATDMPHAVLANVTIPRHGKAGFSSTFQTKVQATGSTSGDYLLGYYLPGDVDGDGTVTKADLASIKKAIGKTVNDNDYVFDADSDRDGVITKKDLQIAKKNLGVSTSITPDFTANLDPSTDDGAADRITNHQTVKFTGAAAPNATITYTEVNGKTAPVSTTAGSNGQYTATVPLAEGTNTFTVTSVDAFGQTIKGSIQPVTYTTGPVPTATSTTSTAAATKTGSSATA